MLAMTNIILEKDHRVFICYGKVATPCDGRLRYDQADDSLKILRIPKGMTQNEAKQIAEVVHQQALDGRLTWQQTILGVNRLH